MTGYIQVKYRIQARTDLLLGYAWLPGLVEERVEQRAVAHEKQPLEAGQVLF